MTPANPAPANVSEAPSELGPRLRAIRLRKGVGVRKLARRLHLSPSAISQIETGKIRPSVRTLYAISGGNVARRLLTGGSEVSGLSRRPRDLDERIRPLSADLEDAEAVAAAVRGTAPTHVFFTTWSRRPTEAENCDVNGRMLRNLGVRGTETSFTELFTRLRVEKIVP